MLAVSPVNGRSADNIAHFLAAGNSRVCHALFGQPLLDGVAPGCVRRGGVQGAAE